MSRFVFAKRHGFSKVVARVIARAHDRARCVRKLPLGGSVLAQKVVVLTPLAYRKIPGALGLVGMALAARTLGTFPDRTGLCAVFGRRYAGNFA